MVAIVARIRYDAESMSQDEFNSSQFQKGILKPAHLTLLVESWQRHHGLAVDGYAGENTVGSLEDELFKRTPLRVHPLIVMPDGRKPIISSVFWTENPDRNGVNGKRHNGVDFVYRWLDTDPAVPVGDGGAVEVNGKRRYWIPDLDAFPHARHALSAAAGEVRQLGEIATGWRMWILHTDGTRSGYFHLAKVFVQDRQVVAMGQPLGVVGHNPDAHDALHLHFEVSPIARYAPMNPRTWLERAGYITA
jgi:murein DD-endopeptidase MepM/ murein hydrolase activator NlpD